MLVRNLLYSSHKAYSLLAVLCSSFCHSDVVCTGNGLTAKLRRLVYCGIGGGGGGGGVLLKVTSDSVFVEQDSHTSLDDHRF